jgi:ATP-dependent RNA helicase RhlE
LEDRGVSSEAIHGNKSQNARQKALDNFSRGKARVLVATDLASRGIDVTGVTHVINYELPADAESYVHRIGRTARAGASGIALSFCDGSERGQLKSIERLTNQRIAVVSTPANEDMPAAPPMRPRAEREENDENQREHRGHHRGPGRPGGGGHGRHRSFGDRSGGDRSGGDRSRGDRPPVQAEHQWPRGDYRDRPQGGHHHGDRPHGGHPHGDRPQGERPQGDRPEGDRYSARPHAKRPYTPRPQGDRPPFGGPRGNGGGNGGGRRFGGGGRGGRGRAA